MMTQADLTPPLPDLVKFRDNLVKAMTDKRMSASDVARAVWGSKPNAQGRMVARNRDRMTHYLAGKGYPRPETVLKLAEVLGLDPKDLEREYDKAAPPRPFVWGNAAGSGESRPTWQAPEAPATGATHPPHHAAAAFSFRLNKRGRVHFSYSVEVDTEMAIRLMDAIRAVDPTLEGEIPSADDPTDA
jgi:hypothetical protein